jgi:cytidine diphosphoramidate kinase
MNFLYFARGLQMKTSAVPDVPRHQLCSLGIDPLNHFEAPSLSPGARVACPGRVYWLTGLACSGKTTLGRLLCQRVRSHGRACVHLDGDELREAFGNDLGHDFGDRWRSARRYSGLSRMFAEQGIDVVCSTISLFHDVQRWNRANIKHYYEILLHAPLPVLISRDRKDLYSRALRGELDNVVGIDLPAQEPEHPDIVIENDGSRSPEALADLLVKTLGLDEGEVA